MTPEERAGRVLFDDGRFTAHDSLRGKIAAAIRAAVIEALEEAIREVVPGGDVCDPQLVADNIWALIVRRQGEEGK